MRKFIATCGLLAAFVSSSAQADFLGLYVGGGVWSHDPSGTFGSTQTGSTVIDMESTLGYSGESETYVWAAFDHFIPLVPNIRLEKTALSHSGSFSGSVFFDGASVTGNSEAMLDSTDTILYYRLLDNWVNLDLGLNLRKLDGEFAVGTKSISVSETIPMLYVNVQFDLPFTGLSVGADIKKISYKEFNYDDIRIRGLYEMGVIGFEAGYRNTSITLEDASGINADIEFKGMMLGMYLHF